jgi:uncharacterized membrane protein
MVGRGAVPRTDLKRARRSPMSPSIEKRALSAGRLFYGAGAAALGGQHFYHAEFVPVIFPSLPAGAQAGGYFWVSLTGMFLVVTGSSIVIGKGARAAGILLGSALLGLLIVRDIPFQLSTAPGPIAAWNNCFKAFTLSGGAFAAAASAPGRELARFDRLFVSFGNLALAVTVAVFGVEHFVYAQFVKDLVPNWIPAHLFWTYFCGAALVAAGAGMILRIRARLAAALLGLMIFTWFLVLHIPRALASHYEDGGNEWTSVFEALAFSGIAFTVACLLPRKAAAA